MNNPLSRFIELGAPGFEKGDYSRAGLNAMSMAYLLSKEWVFQSKAGHNAELNVDPAAADKIVEELLKDKGVLKGYSGMKSSYGQLYVFDDGLIDLFVNDRGQFWADFAARDQETLDRLAGIWNVVLGNLKARFKEDGLDQEHVLSSFWCQGTYGYESKYKNLKIRQWDTIKDNYPAVQNDVENLMNMDVNNLNGRIIVWHGPAGCGKTTAISALAKNWASRGFGIDIILDPERFFSTPKHMLTFGDSKQKKHLLIVEDAAEFLLASQRQVHGHDISRLLNAADGLLSQNCELIFLFTCNEAFGDLDPAISRPGRCLQVLEFPNMTHEQAREWSRKKGRDVYFEAGAEYSLAECFRRLKDAPAPMVAEEQKVGMGFR